MCEEPFSPASTLFGARGGRLDIEKELALTSCILSSKSSSSMPCQLDSELKWLSPCATSSQTIFHPPPRMPEVNRIRCSEIRIIDTSGTDRDFWIETHRLHRLISNNGSPYNTCITPLWPKIKLWIIVRCKLRLLDPSPSPSPSLDFSPSAHPSEPHRPSLDPSTSDPFLFHPLLVEAQ